jgi:hypothetical protein
LEIGMGRIIRLWAAGSSIADCQLMIDDSLGDCGLRECAIPNGAMPQSPDHPMNRQSATGNRRWAATHVR